MLKLIKIMPMDLLYSFVLAVSGFAIGFVGGMVRLVLGVVRFPVAMNVEPSLSITAGTNLGVSTLGSNHSINTSLSTKKYSTSHF